MLDTQNTEEEVRGQRKKNRNRGTGPWEAGPDSLASRCRDMRTVELESGVTSVLEHAFRGCSCCETVVLPAGLRKLQGNPLAELPALQRIVSSSAAFPVVDGALCGDGGRTLRAFPRARGGEFTVPEQVTGIGRQAFYGSSLESVVLPAGLERLGIEAFAGSAELRRVVFQGSAAKIGARCFEGCVSLKEAVLPAGLRELGSRCFAGSGVEHVVIPEGTEVIGRDAFAGSALQTVEIPSTVRTFGAGAFAAPGLRRVTVRGSGVHFPTGLFGTMNRQLVVDAPGMLPEEFPRELRVPALRGAAERCPAGDTASMAPYMNLIRQHRGELWTELPLLEIMLQTHMLNAATLDRMMAEASAAGRADLTAAILEFLSGEDGKLDAPSLYMTNTQALRRIWSSRVLEDGTLELTSFKGSEPEVSVPGEIGRRLVTAAGALCMSPHGRYTRESIRQGRAGLTSVEFSEGIRVIGSGACSGCRKLREVRLPESLERIESSAFCWCTSLTSIIVPPGVTRVGTDAFRECVSLRRVTFLNPDTQLDGRVFAGCSRNLQIWAVPGGEVERRVRRSGAVFRCLSLPARDRIHAASDCTSC